MSLVQSVSFKDLLDGDKAFYKQPDYLEKTKKELAQSKPLPVTYIWNTQPKIIRIAKEIFSIIIFPIAIYHFLQAMAGKGFILPASRRTPEISVIERKKIVIEGEWKYKRLTIEVDGYKVDAMIVGKASTLNNGRWLLDSNGNNGHYEDKLANCYDFKKILSGLHGNGIVFNYPGVGASTGLPNKQAMEKAYRAMLNFLEDSKNGIGAKEIIGYGHSIGGGVQGEALKNHPLKKGIKYVFVKRQTFSDLSTVASMLTNKILGFLVKPLGWNLDSVQSSKKLQAPEIILQTAFVKKNEDISNSPEKIINDGVIPANASLAKVLLQDKNCPKKNKLFIGIPEGHNSPLSNPSYLVEKIEEQLKV